MMGYRSHRSAKFRCAVGLPAFALAQAMAAQTSPYVITGDVVSSLDGAAVPRCRLTARKDEDTRAIRAAGSSRSTNSAEADAHGHFTIVVDAPGHWRLSGAARGFLTQGLQQHGVYSSAVVLTASAPAHAVVLKLDPEAIVTGTVLDEAGEAVRRATVQVVPVRTSGDDLQPAPGRSHPVVATDDRGRYELRSIAPGSYRVAVQAQPWYATASSPAAGRVTPSTSTSPSTPDPSLDVVYAQTWSPGVDDPAAADTVILHAGERREVDFSLRPVPSTHLRIRLPQTPVPAEEARGLPPVQVERLGEGSFHFVPSQIMAGSNHQSEIAGLSAGFYRLVTHPDGAPESEEVSFLQIAGGAGGQIDAAAAVPAARVHLQLRGGGATDDLDVNLIDANSGTAFPSSSGQRGLRRRSAGDSPDRHTIEAPEGTYQVFLSGLVDNTYIQKLVLNGKEIAGRSIAIRQGDTNLDLQLGEGRSYLQGLVKARGRVSEGAMVLLVPASLGDPASINVLRRAETNTDGSFEIRGIIPGQYILVALEGGWDLNWSNGETRARYLEHGTPLDLRPGDSIQQIVESQAP